MPVPTKFIFTQLNTQLVKYTFTDSTTGNPINNMSLVIAIMFVIVAIGLAVDRIFFARLEGWVQERWGLQNA